MEILFRSEKERELYQNERLLRKEHSQLARTITRRLTELEQADNVEEYISIGIGKPHLLNGDYDKCIGIHLNQNYRLIVEPMYDNVDFSAINLTKVKVVTILEVKDYHGK